MAPGPPGLIVESRRRLHVARDLDEEEAQVVKDLGEQALLLPAEVSLRLLLEGL